MTIIESTGDIFETIAEAIVNPVNCVGVMGKGVAAQVKQRYPDVFREYARKCKDGQVHIGRMLPIPTNELIGPPLAGCQHYRIIINFPTKRHWATPSKLAYISDGLFDLVDTAKYLQLGSIAIPALGTGNGGLNWSDVEPLIKNTFAGIDDITVYLYSPHEELKRRAQRE